MTQKNNQYQELSPGEVVSLSTLSETKVSNSKEISFANSRKTETIKKVNPVKVTANDKQELVLRLIIEK